MVKICQIKTGQMLLKIGIFRKSRRSFIRLGTVGTGQSGALAQVFTHHGKYYNLLIIMLIKHLKLQGQSQGIDT